jgi:hypothetical protein
MAAWWFNLYPKIITTVEKEIFARAYNIPGVGSE